MQITLYGMIQAQETGQGTFNGYTFNIPDNWAGAGQNDIYVMGSESEAGLIILVPASFTDNAGLRAGLDREQSDGATISLKRTKSVETISKNALGAEFQGVVNNEQATMYVAGIVFENSRGMILYSGTTSQMYSERYKELLKQIIGTIKAAATVSTNPDAPAANAGNRNDWEQFYGDTRLTYMESYYSAGYGYNDISGGYSSKIIIDLCSKGYFSYNNNFNLSGGSTTTSFGKNDSQQGNGTWSITPQNNHYATLILNFYNGTTEKYTMYYDDKGATYLNNERFYRTTPNDNVQEHRPLCY